MAVVPAARHTLAGFTLERSAGGAGLAIRIPVSMCGAGKTSG